MNDTRLQLITPKSLADLEVIIKEVDFGDAEQFLISCAHYLEIIPSDRKREDPRDIWALFIVYSGDEPVGVAGWYTWPPFDAPRIWLSWFGIRRRFQRRGTGTTLLKQIEKEISDRFHELKWLYVFTDSAVTFYEKCGFENLGTCRDLGIAGHISPDSTFEPEDVVLRKSLNAS